MARKVVFKLDEDGSVHGIKVEKTSTLRFRVTYGLQVREQLYYAEAAKELGECIMHRAACQGRT